MPRHIPSFPACMLGAFLVLGAALGARAEDTKQAPPPEGAVTGVWGENATADHKTKTMDSNISHWQRTADNNWGTNGSVPFIGSGTSHDLVFYFDISDLPKGTKVVKATLEISMETYFRSENAPEVRLGAFMIRDPDSLGRDIPGGWTEGDGKGGPATEGVTFLHRDKKLKIPWAKSVTPPLEPCSFSERMKQIPGENVGYYACVAIRKPLDVLVIKRDPPTKKMAQGWRVLDVTRAAEEWVAGSAPNQGIMVCGIDDVAWNMWVACREHKDAKARPMLRITYVPPADTDADKKPGAAGWWRWHPPFHRGKAGGERWGPA